MSPVNNLYVFSIDNLKGYRLRKVKSAGNRQILKKKDRLLI
jgi:hypothetical protein